MNSAIMKILYLMLIALVFLSCREEPKTIEIIKEVEIQPDMISEDDFNYDTLKGIYSGDFAGSSIRIVVTYVSSTNVLGYNIHKGLQRNISGKVLKSNDTIYMTLAEPGDHEFDGIFNLTFFDADIEPTAIWTSNSGAIKPKSFTLKKYVREKYDPEKLTESTITSFFDASSDTIGEYYFNEDGFVEFKYYPETDSENRIEQYKKIKGTWSFNLTKLIIDWEKNSLFEQNEIFHIVKMDEYELYLQKVDSSRTIWPMYM